MKTCKTCDYIINRHNCYPICQFISNFIQDTYYAPNNEFFVEKNFRCNKWKRINNDKKEIYKHLFKKITSGMIASSFNEDVVFLPCDEIEYPRIMRAINSINKNIFEEYLVCNYSKKQGIKIWKNKE